METIEIIRTNLTFDFEMTLHGIKYNVSSKDKTITAEFDDEETNYSSLSIRKYEELFLIMKALSIKKLYTMFSSDYLEEFNIHLLLNKYCEKIIIQRSGLDDGSWHVELEILKY